MKYLPSPAAFGVDLKFLFHAKNKNNIILQPYQNVSGLKHKVAYLHSSIFRETRDRNVEGLNQCAKYENDYFIFHVKTKRTCFVHYHAKLNGNR